MRNPSTNRALAVRITRMLTCASDRGSVAVIDHRQPSGRPAEITIQRDGAHGTCRKCGGESGLHLQSCPEMAEVLR